MSFLREEWAKFSSWERLGLPIQIEGFNRIIKILCSDRRGRQNIIKVIYWVAKVYLKQTDHTYHRVRSIINLKQNLNCPYYKVIR